MEDHAPLDPPTADIVVTGTKLDARFAAPSPLAAISAEELRRAAPANLADGLAQLPQFAGNNRTTVGTSSVAVGITGQNLLNLRGLGYNRNLVLLDGQRLVPTNQAGSVDINLLPQAMVSRVDVIAGGASAAYGADAVSGVVNFVLDRTSTGLTAAAESGVSWRGDLPSFHGSFRYGGSLLSDRLHVAASAEYFRQTGIDANENSGRAWYERAAGRIANPVAGASPSFIVVDDIRSAIGFPGGVVTAGPLRGTTFLPGGATGSFDHGTVTGTTFQNGGSGARANISLVPDQRRYNAFASLRYDVSDAIHVTVDGLYASSHTSQRAFVEPETGSASQYTIYGDNAFLPASVAALMASGGIASIPVGRYEADFPLVQLEYTTRLYRGSARLDGRLGSRWSWDVGYAYDRTEQRAREGNDPISRRLYAAADAVVDPASGRIVCRSTLSGLDAGCVPLDIFGLESPSAAAIDYVLGTSIKDLTLTQHAAAGNVRGRIGRSILASRRAISVAAGVEYRADDAGQTSDALSQATTDFTGLRGAPAAQNGRQGMFRFFDAQPFNGGTRTAETYVEVGVPLADDKPLLYQLDLNGAVRQARYRAYRASAGFDATTWKIGGTWAPVEGIRVRATRSRDIRAPGIIDLYNGGQFASSTVTYNGMTVPLFQLTRGNPTLTPEKADTLTFGAVVTPRFLPGLSTTLDHYSIDVKGSIASLLAQQQVNLCAAGVQAYCALQTFAGGALTVVTSPLNLNRQHVQGWDLDIVYRAAVAGGALGLRGFLNVNDRDDIRPAVGSLIDNRGAPTNPKWRGTLQIDYDAPRWGVFVQQRLIAPSLIDPTLVSGSGISRNAIPLVSYNDLTVTAKVTARTRLRVTVSNLFDRDPPVSPQPTTTFSIPYSPAYDAIGRAFTIGLRAGLE